MITLYHVSSTRSTRSLWLLNDLGIEFELMEMDFDFKVLRAPEYLAIHALGRVLCLVDDDQTIFESGPITSSLCERHKDMMMAHLSERPVIWSGMNGCNGYITLKPSPYTLQAWSSSQS